LLLIVGIFLCRLWKILCMHLQWSGFTVIVVMQAVVRNILVKGCSWSIVAA